jgi:Spy/CpxP family protein refolding chaperone
MKSTATLLATLVAALFLLPPLARAAETESRSGRSAAGERGAAARERLQANLAELNLTSEQRDKLTPVIRAEMEKMAALRREQGLSPREKLQQLRAIQEDAVPRVKAILTPEQFAKWEKKRAEAREQLQERARQRKR